MLINKLAFSHIDYFRYYWHFWNIVEQQNFNGHFLDGIQLNINTSGMIIIHDICIYEWNRVTDSTSSCAAPVSRVILSIIYHISSLKNI
jgi:hypothetical protein